MADVAHVPHGHETAADAQPDNKIVYRGSPHNMAVGIVLILAGVSAFVMGMTDVFFAEAMAWVFVIWGALFLLNNIVDSTKTWTVTDDALVISHPFRFWSPGESWDWAHINRMDLVARRRDPKVEDIELQVYFTPAGGSVLEREDRVYSPELARMIVEKSGLKPTSSHNPTTYADFGSAKTTYVWNRPGKNVTSQ